MTGKREDEFDIDAWRAYVRAVVGDDRGVDVARRTGIDQGTISRWLNPDSSETRTVSVTPARVRAFCVGYGQNVLEAFVLVGFLTPAEAGLKHRPTALDLRRVSNAALAAEFRRRLGDRDTGTG